MYSVLKSNGTCWVNIGDSYNGSGKNNGNTKVMCDKQASNTASHDVKPLNLKTLPPKYLIGIPWMFAFAMFPQRLILPCIMCGCPENGIVLDPFMGSGTTALVAMKNLRKWIGCEINPDHVKIAEARIANEKGLFDE